jgi:uncharacterized protein YijF (DUF1287 family)
MTGLRTSGVFKWAIVSALLLSVGFISACNSQTPDSAVAKKAENGTTPTVSSDLSTSRTIPLSPKEAFLARLVDAAIERTRHRIIYDPSYFTMKYPGGDVPEGRGVCTDVIVRAYRQVGIDLQKDVHEDMRQNFDTYPKLWDLSAPDRNIDHRRVQNLATFFGRQGEILPVTKTPTDYRPGDIVVWELGNGMQHIGIVIDRRSRDGDQPLVVHNIGAGPRAEDVLFTWKLLGHYRYFGKNESGLDSSSP